jgi:hypothetical protein
VDEFLRSLTSRQVAEWEAYFTLQRRRERSGGMTPAEKFRQWAEAQET